MTPLDHNNANWADGAALVAWLDSLGIRVVAVDPNWTRKVERWRSGRQACFYDVDKLLVKACFEGSRHVSIHVSQVPDEIWCRYNNGRRRQPKAAEPELAVAA